MASMILISLPIAVVTIAIVMFFYLVVLYRKPGKIVDQKVLLLNIDINN